MKCPKCGVEYSDKVWRIHKGICKGTVEETVDNVDNTEKLTEEELRQLAKDNNIKSWHVKGLDKIKEELKELEVI